MESTTVGWRLADPVRLAPPFAGDGERAKNWTQSDYAPAGGLVSSTRDLSRLLEAALGKRSSPLQSALVTCFEPRSDGDRGENRPWRGSCSKCLTGRRSSGTIGPPAGTAVFGVRSQSRSGCGPAGEPRYSTLEPLAFALLKGEGISGSGIGTSRRRPRPIPWKIHSRLKIGHDGDR